MKSIGPGIILLAMSMLIVLVGTAFVSQPSLSMSAALDTPPGPDRYSSIIVDYTEYTWWMLLWENNQVVCELKIDHEGPPNLGDVYVDCGEDVYEAWLKTKPCLELDARDCEGFYIFQVSSKPAQKEITLALPEALAWVSVEECSPVSTISTNLCESIPILVLTGEEPLPNEKIIGIAGTLDGVPFNCGSPCRIQLVPTDEDGLEVRFWAYSSYGDSSDIFTAQVRVAESNEGNPDQTYWYVDVLSSQWIGEPVATCSDSWESFPPVGGPPIWLQTPKRPEDLVTEVPYTYLAANLIRAGMADASSCSNGGLLPEGNGANPCGLEAARPAIMEWQNRFNTVILEVAQETGVPAQMLKNLFARESQFWPALFAEKSDIGLGQLTENGADTTMIWNPSFYYQFCPLILPSERCDKGYLHLDDEEKSILRMGLVSSVDATCLNCPLGIDLTRADFSVSVFGHALLANCEQAGRVVRNVSGDAPGKVASYEDMWKFTLVNYNAGPGCLGDALEATDELGLPYNWENVSANLTGVCNLAVDYVNDISQ